MVMANGKDEFMSCTKIRTGLKREFAFALKAQSEICGSLGRTRSRRREDDTGTNSSNKRWKNSGVKARTGRALEEKKLHVENKHSSEREIEKTAETSERNGDIAEISTTSVTPVDSSSPVALELEGVNCISEEEPKSDIVDETSDDERKSHLVEPINQDDVSKGALEEEPNGNVVESISSDGVLSTKGESNISNRAMAHDDALEAESRVEIVADKPIMVVEGRNEGTIKDDRMSHISTMDDGDDMTYLKRLTMSTTEENMNMDGEACEAQAGNLKHKTVAVVEGHGVGTSNTSTISSSANIPDMNLGRSHIKKCLIRLKDLIGTGILEGMKVMYLRGSKVRDPNETALHGVIKGSGILCHCASCTGSEVVTPNQFELHAGSGNKRPPEYIYLESGRTLRDVINVCKDAPANELEKRLKIVLGCSTLLEPKKCLRCRGSINGALPGIGALLCRSCLGLTETHVSTELPTRTIFKSPDSHASCKSSDNVPKMGSSRLKFRGRLTKKSPDSHAPCKSLDSVSKMSSSRPKIRGRLTKKDVRLHRLVFEEDVLPDGTEVAYYVRGQKLLVGYKKGLGILCTCCNSEVSPSQFEAHAGWASRRKPYLHIYTSNGVSLHELSISLSRSRKFAVNENDDLCSICADGGDILCCDGCPRAFHKECIFLQTIPQDTWYCKYCETIFQNERLAQHNANAVAAGRVAGIDPIEQITKRCIRIAKTPESQFGGCVLCRGHGFSKSGFGPQTVILCDQCEKEYHVGCLRAHNMEDLKELPEGAWFCCTSCSSINSTLHSLVTQGESELPESLLSIIKKKQESSQDGEMSSNIAISWRLLRGKLVSDDTRALLSRAVAIFHEQFAPILESGTNKDFIPHMVYGRDMRDQEFGNMFCAVLTVNSLVVTAALFRIFGEDVAELPLVATSSDYNARGYFQCLFSCIEGLLASLNVRNFVLPAADEAESIWTNKFDFRKLTVDEFNEFRKDHPMIMTFQGTSMLHKNVLKDTVSKNP